jgi:hypothetical protein
MYILCKDGSDWGEWYPLSASQDKAALEEEAERLEVAEDHNNHAEWLAHGKQGPCPLTLNDPRLKGYRTFYVIAVADWPAQDKA